MEPAQSLIEALHATWYLMHMGEAVFSGSGAHPSSSSGDMWLRRSLSQFVSYSCGKTLSKSNLGRCLFYLTFSCQVCHWCPPPSIINQEDAPTDLPTGQCEWIVFSFEVPSSLEDPGFCQIDNKIKQTNNNNNSNKTKQTNRTKPKPKTPTFFFWAFPETFLLYGY